jgi:hypothetical protein
MQKFNIKNYMKQEQTKDLNDSEPWFHTLWFPLFYAFRNPQEFSLPFYGFPISPYPHIHIHSPCLNTSLNSTTYSQETKTSPHSAEFRAKNEKNLVSQRWCFESNNRAWSNPADVENKKQKEIARKNRNLLT